MSNIKYLTIKDVLNLICDGYPREKLVKELYFYKENPLTFKWIKGDLNE